MRWSYKTVHYELKKEGLLGSTFLDESEVEKSLNEYGKSGWELVSILETMDGLIAVFKQPLSYDKDVYTSSPQEAVPMDFSTEVVESREQSSKTKTSYEQVSSEQDDFHLKEDDEKETFRADSFSEETFKEEPVDYLVDVGETSEEEDPEDVGSIRIE
jgi:hypothetical protein